MELQNLVEASTAITNNDIMAVKGPSGRTTPTSTDLKQT
jgi:hypothetical protein